MSSAIERIKQQSERRWWRQHEYGAPVTKRARVAAGGSTLALLPHRLQNRDDAWLTIAGGGLRGLITGTIPTMAGNSDLQYLQSSHYVAVPHVVNAENIVLPVIYAVYPVDLLQTNEPLAVRDSYEMIDNVKQKLSLDSVTGVNGDSIKQQ